MAFSYCVCHQVAYLLLIHFGLGLVALVLGLIALGFGLDLVASVSYTSGLVNIPDNYPANFIKKLACFNRYKRLKFIKFTFSSEHAVAYYIFSNIESNFALAFRQQFKHFRDECKLPSLYLNCVKCQPAAATHRRILFRNDRIVLSMNSCSNHSISTARQSSAWQCWTVLMCISDGVAASGPRMII